MSKIKQTLIQIRFVDLMNKPFANLYHEVRVSGDKYAASAGTSDAKGLGVWIEKPVGTQLDILVRHPLTKKLISAKHHVIVPAKKGVFRIQAPFSIQTVKLRALEKSGGSYKRSTYKVVAGKGEYEVKTGQDLYTIAKIHNTTWQILAQLNKATIKDPNKIFPGQIIKVPPKGSSLTGTTNDKPDSLQNQTHYKVKKGETLSGISQRSGVSVDELKRINGINDPTKLQAGQTIRLRGNGSAKPQANPKPTSPVTPKPTLPETPKPTPTVKPKPTPPSSKEDNGKAPAAGANSKTPIKIPVEQEYSSKDGTPKLVSGAVCKDDPACIFKGKTTNEAEKKLVLEVNIRLAGFGGALPDSNFTDLTEKCIKQFQRDYMKAPETGKICGSLVKAIDKFNYEYPIGSYYEQMKCPCGQCSGFGNGRMGVPSGKNIANEYPGIHRSVIWMLKAMMFYLDSVYPELKFTLRLIYSAYRCIVRNEQKERTTVNHMGLAFDMHFNKNGARTKSTSDMEKIRKVVFIQQMNASLKRETNIIWLEPSNWNDGSNAATTWVHYDVSRYEEKYLKASFFSKTVVGMIGGDLSTHANNKILACGGDFIVRSKSQSVKSIGGIVGKVIASHESQGGRYDIFNRGTVGDYAWTSGYEDIGNRTIDEWRKLGALSGDNKAKRFAMGKYQIIPDTLGEVQKSLKLSGSTKLTPETQELMFLEHFIKKTNIITAIKSGSSKDIGSATMKIAKIWASVGVPYATSRVAYKKVNNKSVAYTIYLKKDQSYWSGTGGNKAHTPSALVVKALEDMNNDYKTLMSQGLSSEQAFEKVMSVDTKLF